MLKWGYTFRWGDTVYSVDGFSSWADMEQDRRNLIEDLRKQGWTPPRWWQFWRLGDSRPNDAAQEKSRQP